MVTSRKACNKMLHTLIAHLLCLLSPLCTFSIISCIGLLEDFDSKDNREDLTVFNDLHFLSRPISVLKVDAKFCSTVQIL